MADRMTAPLRESVRCELCRFFSEIHGECRQAPPVVLSVEGIGEERAEIMTVWPVVTPMDFCGSYEYDARKDTETY